MCLLFESVKVRNRQLFNLEAHNRRIAESRSALFGLNDTINLHDFISFPTDLDDGLYKCRVVYAQTIQNIEFVPYIPKSIRTLQIIHADTLQYDRKYLDRYCIDALLQNAHADDILISQYGCITDASFANVVFLDGKQWVTPTRPLIVGTKRQLLLEQGIIQEAEISLHKLHRFACAALINAMLDIGDIPFVPMEQIFCSS